MARAPRRFGRAAAALLALGLTVDHPVHAAARDFATVGRIGVRVVDGRTLILVPVAGPGRLRLSEPLHMAGRSRLMLTVENARRGIGGAAARRAEGLLALSVLEARNDVVIAVDVARLGDYALRPTEAGYLLSIGTERRPVRAAPAPLAMGPAGPGRGADVGPVAISGTTPSPQPDAGRGRSWPGWLILGLAAAGGGWWFGRIRVYGLPAWAEAAVDRSRSWSRARLAARAAREGP